MCACKSDKKKPKHAALHGIGGEYVLVDVGQVVFPPGVVWCLHDAAHVIHVREMLEADEFFYVLKFVECFLKRNCNSFLCKYFWVFKWFGCFSGLDVSSVF